MPPARRLPLTIAAVALLLGSVTAGPSADADAFSVPQPPTAVSAEVLKHGIKVTWQASPPAAPGITDYIVSAGPDSCPVTVRGDVTSAVLPFIAGPTSVTPTVQAVNAYGLSTAAAGPTLTVSGARTAGYRNVQFLEFSDFHGAVEKTGSSIGAAALATTFAANRRTVPSTFVVSAGDNFGGSAVLSAAFGEIPTLKALNAMGVDVSTLGNHEHDEPVPALRKQLDQTDVQWVASNYESLAPLQGKSNGVSSATMLVRAGIRVGFVGMNVPQLADLVMPTNLRYGRDQRRTLVVTETTRTVQGLVDDLRSDGASLVVLLVHEGWDANLDGKAVGALIDVANAVHGVDAIFGGHTHLQYASMIKGVPVVEVPNSGQMYSRVVVCLDTKTGRRVGSSIGFVTKAAVAAVPDDPAVTAMIDSYKAQLGSRLDTVVGTVSGVFPRGGTPPVERSGETPMGNFAADAVRARYHTDFVILNGGSIRDTLPAKGYTPVTTGLRRPAAGSSGPYDVTMGDVQAVFPFGNNAATTTITGAGLWSALENGVSGWPTDGRFPQVSGLKFTFDPSKPVGSRITSVTTSDGTPIARDGTVYSIATIDYMIYGGDGYTNMFSPTTAVVREPYISAVLMALRADTDAGRVTQVPAPDGRIIRVGS
ncbi:MAG: 5'-nucleotidase C-terminal domain-containing protein [Actinomycetes bacterium]